MTQIQGQIPDNHEEYRGAVIERRNNRTNRKEWCAKFTHPSAPLDNREVLWLSIPDGHSWFVDREDLRWFCLAIENRRNVAVKFNRLQDAYGFLTHLRPCEIVDAATVRCDE
jgi:hypothetical protein